MKSNLFIVSKNGYKYIGYALFATIIFGILDLELFSFFSFIVALFFIYSFRNPEREVAFLDEKAVVSPVDGIVKAIDEIQEEEYAYRVRIESNYRHVGVLRIPLCAKVETFTIFRGARVSKKSKLFFDLNEMAELVFVDAHNNKVKVLHRLKQSFTPIDIEVSKNEPLNKGARYGYASNCISELYLPKNFRLDMKLNSEIEASHSLIGYFS